MKNPLFLPEVRRNRLVTNWVWARSQPLSSNLPTGSKLRKSRAVVLGILVLIVCLATAMAVLEWQSHASKADRETASQSSKSRTAKSPKPVQLSIQTSCDVEDSFLRLNAERPSRLDAPSVAGFDKIVSHVLGGVVIADYRCDDSSEGALFRVRWEFKNALWQVKEISRPPEGWSGDLKGW